MSPPAASSPGDRGVFSPGDLSRPATASRPAAASRPANASGPADAAPLPVVVVGAGAAGLMAAIHAAGGGGGVVLLERTADGGRKILISGGGRCNVLPSRLDPRDYVTDSSPHTLRKILLSWPLAEQRRFFEETLGIHLVLEPETGKLFPDGNRAREVRDRLVEEARRRGVETRFGVTVSGFRPDGDGWLVHTGGDDGTLRASAVVVATGGLSVPATGSDGIGLRELEAVGHTVTPLYPALTPLTESPPTHAPLAGVSLPVTMTAPGAGGRTSHGGFLFTHRGFSGPAVLDLSHLAVRSRMAGHPRRLTVQWTELDADGWDGLLREGNGLVAGALRTHLPQRLADTLMDEAAVDPARPLHQLRRDERRRLVEALTAWTLPWSGDEGYRKAEVTGGGVALGEVDPRTLESRLHPGLFLCGELLDAFGPIGGYNFAWAWATGRLAGEGARARAGGG